jgi:hypothetical protein
MIRTLTVSALLGALTAGVGVYTVNSPLWQTVMGGQSGGPEQTADFEAAIENWPICTTTGETSYVDYAKLHPDVALSYAGLRVLAAKDVDYAKLHPDVAALGSPALAQTYGLGQAPTAEQIGAPDLQN